MGKKLTLAERQRNEFEKEVKKQLVMLFTSGEPINELTSGKRILRAYDIAEMRIALYEAQHSEQ